MGTQGKRGTGGQKGPRRARTALQDVMRDPASCLHTNAAITLDGRITRSVQAMWNLSPVIVTCPECGKAERLTDRDAGAILALIAGGR